MHFFSFLLEIATEEKAMAIWFIKGEWDKNDLTLLPLMKEKLNYSLSVYQEHTWDTDTGVRGGYTLTGGSRPSHIADYLVRA